MKQLFLIILSLLFTGMVHAGHETGNGGNLDDLLRADQVDKITLSYDQMQEILSKNAKELKEKVIIPSFTYFLKEDSNNLKTKLKGLQIILNESSEDIAQVINLTSISEGDCGDNDFCTGDNAYDPIKVNLRNLADRDIGITLAEFVGLIAHEFTHQFVGDFDHPDYVFARYIREVVSKNLYSLSISKTFNVDEIMDIVSTDKERRILAIDNKDLEGAIDTGSIIDKVKIKPQLDYFCQYAGYEKSVDRAFEVLSIDDLELEGLIVKNDKEVLVRSVEFKESSLRGLYMKEKLFQSKKWIGTLFSVFYKEKVKSNIILSKITCEK